MSSPVIPVFRTGTISVGTTSTSLQDTPLTPGQQTGVFAPQRPVAIISHVPNQISSLQQQISDLSDNVATVSVAQAANGAVPAIPTNVSAVASPYKTAQGELVSLVSVSFEDSNPNFAYANIYLTGYGSGNSTPALATTGTTSPISFLAQITNQTVTITVQALNSSGGGQDLSSCPTTTVLLGNVTEAPPPPSIAVPLTVTILGYSFTFNVENGLLEDVISGYNVYRNTTNTFTGSTQIEHLAQPTTNQGTIEVDDSQLNANTEYLYWVTSVNTSGLESTPTSAGAASAFGVPQQVTNLDAVQEPITTADGTIKSLVAVAFDPAANDPFSDFFQVWFTNYNANPNPQLISQGSSSPIQFLCEETYENVTVNVVVVSANDVPSDTPPFSVAPSVVLALNGQAGAPPFPSVAQSQSALAGNLGWQFQINVIGGLEGQTIAGYRVYHSESNEDPTPGANSSDYYTFIAQPPTNSGVLTVQETTGDIRFYWVSAVSTTGLESLLNPVEFVFVDPNAPAPPIPSPVTTTNTYTPTTLLNGWATGQHVQYQPENPGTAGPNPPGLGTSFGPASQNVSPFGTPQAAYDGNQSTSATAINSHLAVYQGCVWSFASPSLAAGSTVTAATLNITSNVVATSGPAAGQGSMWYSIDGGNTWTNVYIATNATRATTTDTITLPTTQNFANVQVMANLHSHDDLGQNVFEINLSITTSSAAGPGQVVGASISLVSNDVALTWPGLLPTNRTDITGYDVIRVVHGGGFAHGNVQATIPFVSGQATYTYSDPQGHDGTFDYYIAAVGTGGIGIPSNVQNLGGAASLIYTSASGEIATVDSLRPAQVGADVTSQNTSLQTSNLNNHTLDNLADGVSFKRVSATHIGAGGSLQYTTGTSIDSLMPLQAGADVTHENTAAGIAGQGALATQSSVSLPSQVSGQLPLANHAPVVALASTGQQKNLIPDSGVKFGSTYWTVVAGFELTIGGSASSSNAWFVPGNGGTLGGLSVNSGAITLTPGLAYTLACSVNSSVIESGSCVLLLIDSATGNVCGELAIGSQPSNRFSTTFTLPASTSRGFVVIAGSTAVVASGFSLVFSDPQLELGSIATNYKENIGDNATGFLKAGSSQIDFSSSMHLNKTTSNIAQSSGLFYSAEAGANVTANHVITAQSIATGSTILSTSLAAISGFGFSVTAASTSDTFRIEASIALQPGNSNTITVALVIDGNTSSPAMSLSYFMSANTSVPFFALVSGLGGGAHTLQFYASAGTTANLTQNSVAQATRVF